MGGTVLSNLGEGVAGGEGELEGEQAEHHHHDAEAVVGALVRVRVRVRVRVLPRQKEGIRCGARCGPEDIPASSWPLRRR